jgi:hypothetical protein
MGGPAGAQQPLLPLSYAHTTAPIASVSPFDVALHLGSLFDAVDTLFLPQDMADMAFCARKMLGRIG